MPTAVKSARQPKVVFSILPIKGEKPGAVAAAIIVSDNARARFSPS